MEPLLTLGLPFYNNVTTIELALKSIFNQTYKNWELLLIDDGSNDKSLEIANRASRDSRVRLIIDEVNRGLIFRLNQIAQLGHGDYLGRMDADDMMMPERLEKQMRFLLNNPDVDVVDTGAYSINENNYPVGKRGLNDIDTDPKQSLKHTMLLHGSVVGKRAWFLNNPYSEDYVRAEDYELWCRTRNKSKFARVKEPLYIVREGKVNVRNYAKSSKTIRKIFRNYSHGIFSSAELNKELIKSKLKVLTYQVFELFNKHDYLSKTRNIPLSASEMAHVNQIIKEIERQDFNVSILK